MSDPSLAFLASSFSQVRLRPRSPACVVCGDSPTVTAASLPSLDYQAFTASPFNDQVGGCATFIHACLHACVADKHLSADS